MNELVYLTAGIEFKKKKEKTKSQLMNLNIMICFNKLVHVSKAYKSDNTNLTANIGFLTIVNLGFFLIESL